MKLPKIKTCDRVTYIIDACRGKNVLHLGCADWPFTETKAKKPTFLHRLITEVSTSTTGVDINDTAVTMMATYGFDNVVSVDAEKTLYESLGGGAYDVIIAGEILEHVLNAGVFLESIKSVMRKDSILIITTPNFTPIKRIPRLLFGREEVHPDHVYYFSYSTLSKLLSMTGYEIVDVKMHWWDVGRISKAVNKLFRRIPFIQYYADTICLTARKETHNGLI